MRGTGSPENTWSTAVDEPAVIRLPPLAGGQAESWRALIEFAPQLGHHWLLIGGQMVYPHEVERESTDVRPTNDTSTSRRPRTQSPDCSDHSPGSVYPPEVRHRPRVDALGIRRYWRSDPNRAV